MIRVALGLERASRLWSAPRLPLGSWRPTTAWSLRCDRRRFATSVRLLQQPSARIDLSSPLDLDASPYLDASRYRQATADEHVVDPDDFVLYPSFFDEDEQRLLLRCALAKLDLASSSREARKKRRLWKERTQDHTGGGTPGAEADFLPDEAYAFEEGHFDGVINGYRETQVVDWDNVVSGSTDADALSKLLGRLYPLVPSHGSSFEPSLKTPPGILAHLLHLSSAGKIDPHVDNVDASGEVILGVSLGGVRVMHLREMNAADGGRSLDVLLVPGSVYVQRSVAGSLPPLSVLTTHE